MLRDTLADELSFGPVGVRDLKLAGVCLNLKAGEQVHLPGLHTLCLASCIIHEIGQSTSHLQKFARDILPLDLRCCQPWMPSRLLATASCF